VQLYFVLSWRNLWRQKRRTLIAAASVFFAVILAIVMRSAQLGSYAYMIHSSAQLYTGYFQVQNEDYWYKRSLEESYILPKKLTGQLDSIPFVESVTPRLETFALISHGSKTKVAQVIGIAPQQEEKMSRLAQRLSDGVYLTEDSQSVILGKELARLLSAQVGDSVVIYGVGFHGVPAAALLPIAGIAELPIPSLDRATLFMPLNAAQYTFTAEGRITSLSVMLDNVRHQTQVMQAARKSISGMSGLMLKSWEEMLPEVKQNIEFDTVGGMIMLTILYIVIAFGVLGTIMMMTQERRREFAILISVGMKKQRLMAVSFLESLYINLLGAIVGMIGSLPIIIYFFYHPIVLSGEAAKAYLNLGIEPVMKFALHGEIFAYQGLIVLLIAIVASTYPLFFIRKLHPGTAIRD
jgi:ABC-type lipoprotein release transport system permease subunit